MRMRATPSVLFVLSAAFALGACSSSKGATKTGGTSGGGDGSQATQLASVCGEEGRTQDARQTDVDGDGRPEVVKFYQEGDDPERPGERRPLLTRQDIDLNWDGRLDVCRYFMPTGMVTREEIDLDYDGRIDDVRFYEDGAVARSERDRNNDGKADVIRRYKGGKLVQKDVDTNDDGQADRWEYFDGEKLDRVGIDLDHDGKVDRWAKAGP